VSGILTSTSCIANGAKQKAHTLPKLLVWQDTFSNSNFL